jgi:hypothetical protein
LDGLLAEAGLCEYLCFESISWDYSHRSEVGKDWYRR